MLIWEGLTKFRTNKHENRRTIQAILTGHKSGSPSKNSKTGPVVQLHILDKERNPVDAQSTGDDSAVCGTCAHRHIEAQKKNANEADGHCYVETARAELSTWRAHYGNEVEPFNAVDALSRSGLRLGAYGDPAMLPEKVIRRLCAVANKFRQNHTGFTQRWRLKSNQWLRFFCMASVRSADEAQQAHDLGWRTFRIRSKTEPIEPGEITCPASKEAGRRTTCQRCVLCDGMRSESDSRKHIVIIRH